ncbi:hypothetical protein [Candidatus Amarobacter glycogenicus]|uniref:hypothetical protein n=1 Tax=Candidatus Amarobacter glycogenicus TaxID=3140699 RepID=UPI003136DB23|nr:hypothetical protein [Dehalococcoidia bacterium]
MKLKLLLASVVVVVAAVAGSGAASPAPRDAEAGAPFAALGRAFVGTIAQAVHRGNTYERLEGQRDEEIRATKQKDQIIEFHAQRGWLDAQAAERERQRLDELRRAITVRTEREKNITRVAYNRAIGREWKNAAATALPGAVGLQGFTGGFVGGVLRGDSPLNAAVNALSGSAPNNTQSLDDLKKQLVESRAQLRVARDKKLTERLDELLGEMNSQPPGQKVDVARTLLRDEIDAVAAALKQAKTTWKDWTGNKVQINAERFARDARWQELNTNVQATQVSTAEKAIIAGLGRAAAERIDRMSEKGGVKLSDEDLVRIAAEAGARFVAARAAARDAGESADSIDLDSLVRAAINEHLLQAGLAPLPEEGDRQAARPTESGPSTADSGKPKAVVAKGSVVLRGAKAPAVIASGAFFILDSEFVMDLPAEDGAIRGSATATLRIDDKLFFGSWATEVCIADYYYSFTLDGTLQGATITGTARLTGSISVVQGCQKTTFDPVQVQLFSFQGTFDRNTATVDGWFNEVDGEDFDPEFYIAFEGKGK